MTEVTKDNKQKTQGIGTDRHHKVHISNDVGHRVIIN